MHHLLDQYGFANKYFDSPSKPADSESAKALGTAVHTEIKDYIKDPNVRREYHYQTLYFFQTLQILGWEPLDADVPMNDDLLHYKTRADVVAFHAATNTTVIIEVKTTLATREEALAQIEQFKANELKSSLWEELKIDMPVNRAIAQATLEYHAMKSKYGRTNACVIYLFRNPTFVATPPLNQPKVNSDEYKQHVLLYQVYSKLLSDAFYQTLL